MNSWFYIHVHVINELPLSVPHPCCVLSDNPPPKPKRPPKEVLNRYSYQHQQQRQQQHQQQQQQTSRAVNILQSLFGTVECDIMCVCVCARTHACVGVLINYLLLALPFFTARR